MAAVFPPWSNTVFRLGLGIIALGGISAITLPMLFVRSSWRRGTENALDQPVEFDHRHHNQDDAIDCYYCHNTADRAATAGIPSTDKCMGCHSQIWNDSPLLEPVRRSYFSGKPIPWNRVHKVPDFVYFNHAIHVNKGVGCASCHGRVDQMAAVYQAESLTMAWCISCHREPERNLRPLSEITNMTWDAGDRQAEIGAAVARQLDVRTLVNCTTCHR